MAVLVFVGLATLSWATVELMRAPAPNPVDSIELELPEEPARQTRRDRPRDRPDDGGAPPAPAPAPPPAGGGGTDDDPDDDDDGDSVDDSD